MYIFNEIYLYLGLNTLLALYTKTLSWTSIHSMDFAKQMRNKSALQMPQDLVRRYET